MVNNFNSAPVSAVSCDLDMSDKLYRTARQDTLLTAQELLSQNPDIITEHANNIPVNGLSPISHQDILGAKNDRLNLTISEGIACNSPTLKLQLISSSRYRNIAPFNAIENNGPNNYFDVSKSGENNTSLIGCYELCASLDKMLPEANEELLPLCFGKHANSFNGLTQAIGGKLITLAGLIKIEQSFLATDSALHYDSSNLSQSNPFFMEADARLAIKTVPRDDREDEYVSLSFVAPFVTQANSAVNTDEGPKKTTVEHTIYKQFQYGFSSKSEACQPLAKLSLLSATAPRPKLNQLLRQSWLQDNPLAPAKRALEILQESKLGNESNVFPAD